jgi:hypothetical protein
VTRLFGSSRRASIDVDQYDRQAMPPEHPDQRGGTLHDPANRMNEGSADETGLQIDNDEGGVGVDRRESHDRFLLGRASCVA